VFSNDSVWLTTGVGARFNNPCNVRCLDLNTSLFQSACTNGGVSGLFAKFDAPEEGIAACVELYTRKYSGLSPEKLVAKWASTTPERNPKYFNDVKACF
jgi:hypothetical protein